jgi:hypothetical protein
MVVGRAKASHSSPEIQIYMVDEPGLFFDTADCIYKLTFQDASWLVYHNEGCGNKKTGLGSSANPLY